MTAGPGTTWHGSNQSLGDRLPISAATYRLSAVSLVAHRVCMDLIWADLGMLTLTDAPASGVSPGWSYRVRTVRFISAAGIGMVHARGICGVQRACPASATAWPDHIPQRGLQLGQVHAGEGPPGSARRTFHACLLRSSGRRWDAAAAPRGERAVRLVASERPRFFAGFHRCLPA